MSTLTWQVQTNTPFQLHDPTNGYRLVDYTVAGRKRRLDFADSSEMFDGDQVNAAPWGSSSPALTLRIEGSSISTWKTRLDALVVELSKSNLTISIACGGTTVETWKGIWLEEMSAIGMGGDGKSGHSKFGFMAPVKKQDYEFRFMSVVPV